MQSLKECMAIPGYKLLFINNPLNSERTSYNPEEYISAAHVTKTCFPGYISNFYKSIRETTQKKTGQSIRKEKLQSTEQRKISI